MRTNLSSLILGSFIVWIISMAGCGGGGGGGATLPPPTPPPPPANTSPLASNDMAVTVRSTPLDIAVLANDSDYDGDPLTVTTVSLASHGTVSINGAGTVRYTPTTGFIGLDGFTYSIADGRGGTSTAAVSLTVSFPDGLPVERTSVATSGSQGNANSWMGAISADGRYVVFHSDATNLVAGATQGDIFLRDRVTSQTTLVSSSVAGIPGNNMSQQPAISGDGNYIVFASFASNLVPGDFNGESDIFVKNLQNGAIERVSVASDGSQGNSGSYAPSISADGRYVAFVSMATNFFPGDSAGSWDVFIHDRQTGQTKHVDSGGNFNEGPSISGNGRYVAFESSGQIYVYDQQTGQNSLASFIPLDGGIISIPGNGASGRPTISEDGRYVAFNSVATNLVSGDTNFFRDVFVCDLKSAKTTRVSVDSDGTQGNGPVNDLERPSISSDGRFVAFTSSASNLVLTDTNGLTDIFVHDMTTGQTRRVSVSASGVESNGASGDSVVVSMTANGADIVFSSAASNLVVGDTNGFRDVFIAPNPLAP